MAAVQNLDDKQRDDGGKSDKQGVEDGKEEICR